MLFDQGSIELFIDSRLDDIGFSRGSCEVLRRAFSVYASPAGKCEDNEEQDELKATDEVLLSGIEGELVFDGDPGKQ